MLPGDLEGQVKETEAKFNVAKAELSQAKVDLKSAEIQAKVAYNELERYRQLINYNAVSLAKFEDIEAENERAQADVECAAENIRTLEAKVNQAQVAVDNARRAAAKGCLVSTRDGVVLQTVAQEGKMLGVGDLVLTVGDPRRLQVVAELNEKDSNGVVAGQMVEISWDGRPDETFQGEVARVSLAVTKSEEREAGKVVRVYIALDQADLLPGASVDVTIHRIKPRKALLIPIGDIIEKDSQKFVLTVEEGIVHEKEINTGYSNGIYTEILSGLVPGAEVILKPDNINDGQSVSVSRGADD